MIGSGGSLLPVPVPGLGQGWWVRFVCAAEGCCGTMEADVGVGVIEEVGMAGVYC